MKPSNAQLIAKTRFWEKASGNPMYANGNVPAIRAAHLAGNNQVQEWLQDPEFAGWFFNKDAAQQMLQAGAELAIARLIQIVSTDKVGPREAVTVSSQVTAAKTLLEMAGFNNQKPEGKFKDKEIAEMGEEELEIYVQTNVQKLGIGGGSTNE